MNQLPSSDPDTAYSSLGPRKFTKKIIIDELTYIFLYQEFTVLNVTGTGVSSTGENQRDSTVRKLMILDVAVEFKCRFMIVG